MKMKTPATGTSLQLPGLMANASRKPKPDTQGLLEDVDDLIPAPRLERKNKLAKQAVRPKRAAFAVGKQTFNKGPEAFT